MKPVNLNNTNAVCNKIAARFQSPKLQPWVSKMHDFSKINTMNRISTSVDNFNTASNAMSGAGDGVYTVDFSINNYNTNATARDFSGIPGAAHSGAEGVRGVDVIDMTVIATVQSMIPTLAVDFGMSKPTDVITYQKLVAVDAHGNIAAGEDVINPFKPINSKATTSVLGITLDANTTVGTGETEGSLSLNAPVIPGSVKVTITDGAIGEDVTRDGTIYFLSGATKGILTANVDYATGDISYTCEDTCTAALSASANPDMSGESDGTNTLRLTPQAFKITVDAVQHSVNLVNNIESTAFLNKQVAGKNFGQIATRQMLDAFIYTLNAGVVNETIKLAVAEVPTAKVKVLDLSSYYGSEYNVFAGTKTDRILDFLNGLGQDMLLNSNKEFTYLLCGNGATRIFQTMQGYFEALPQVGVMQDSVVGYLNLGHAQVAVVRHQAMNALDSAEGGFNFILGYRDPTATAAPVGYFEYLPICSTRVSLNYQNPTQFSQSVFNYSNSAELVKQYVYRGRFKREK